MYRIWLPWGHCYTTSQAEAEHLVKSERGTIEPMEFVYTKKAPGTVRLYRFGRKGEKASRKNFLTAYEPEKQDVLKAGGRLLPMKAYVFLHAPPDDKDVIPVHRFYDPEAGEHFYTTSEEEKENLIAQTAKTVEARAKEAEEKRRAVAERYQKLRKNRPAAAGLPGEPVRIGQVEWTVLGARRLGKTLKSDNRLIDDLAASAEFVQVELRVENKGKRPLTLVAPKLFDSEGREFADSAEADWFVPNDKRLRLLRTLNPSVPFTCAVIYDVAEGATGLALVVGDLDLFESGEGAVNLGL